MKPHFVLPQNFTAYDVYVSNKKNSDASEEARSNWL